MNELAKFEDPSAAPWRVCLECGNRYQSAQHGYKVSWCSLKCERASMKRQRDEVATSWVRARWFLR
jgi:hypothetical protein